MSNVLTGCGPRPRPYVAALDEATAYPRIGATREDHFCTSFSGISSSLLTSPRTRSSRLCASACRAASLVRPRIPPVPCRSSTPSSAAGCGRRDHCSTEALVPRRPRQCAYRLVSGLVVSARGNTCKAVGAQRLVQPPYEVLAPALDALFWIRYPQGETSDSRVASASRSPGHPRPTVRSERFSRRARPESPRGRAPCGDHAIGEHHPARARRR